MRFGSRLFLAFLIVLMLAVLPGDWSQARSLPQGSTAREKALALMAQMTPAERVGQLFVVSMNGVAFDETSQIYDLITKYHVGGVMLLRSNDNFTDADNNIQLASELINHLQRSVWDASRSNPAVQLAGEASQYVPLFIGISQEGDGYPNDQLLSGLTSLPSLMSIGATWNPALARQVGEVMGHELRALGFNLYLGPSLDVLDVRQMEGGEDLGVRTFGSDPYWVGKMGQAYIAGLHQGSDGGLAVIAKHFPGRGSSDRSPEEEIATVRKSLEQLKQIELAPFFAVTGNAPSSDMIVDGLMVSHIRYQGFQGNIRDTTRPVSMDATALDLILQEEPLADWRAAGGLLVSDNLGSQAVRRFYDPTGIAFDARTAARESFFAGNDLLFLDRFIASGDPDSYTTIVRTLEFFTQKYREDPAFAERVDASLARVLTMKYQLYPEFDLASVTPDLSGLEVVGKADQVVSEVARRSVTLISPEVEELTNVLPRPPELGERILFLTDVQAARQCSGCADQTTLAFDTLQNAVLRLYGPRAGGLISAGRVSSFSFADLAKYLSGSTEVEQIENDFMIANWVVVSIQQPLTSRPDSQAFRRLLSERPDLIRNKKVVVFAFNAPYYLDATDISKLTAYYGLYSKAPPFVDTAAKILFQEQTAAGALPVSVPGIGLDLINITSPDPDQLIPLYIDLPNITNPVTGGTLEPTPAPIFEVGDIVPLRTGVIYDHNHNPVPDETPVRFLFNVIGQGSSNQTQVETRTVDGVARSMYRIERSGILEITVETEQGARSSLLRLDTLSGGVTVVAPSPMPTETPTPTITVTVTPTPTITPTPPPPPKVAVTDWFFALLLVLGTGVVAAIAGIRLMVTRWGLRWALCGVIGGMLAYLYLAMDFPGSSNLLRDSGLPGVLVVALAGVVAGWVVGLLWRQIAQPGVRGQHDRPVTGPKSQSG